MEATLPRLLTGIGPTWTGSDRYQHWYRARGQHLGARAFLSATITVRVGARIHVALLPQTHHDLHRASTDKNWGVRQVAVQAIAAGWAEDPATLPLLRERASTDQHEGVRRAAVQAIAAGWAEDPATLEWLRERASTDDNEFVRRAAVQAIARVDHAQKTTDT